MGEPPEPVASLATAVCGEGKSDLDDERRVEKVSGGVQVYGAYS
jgi:hypothetical protein